MSSPYDNLPLFELTKEMASVRCRYCKLEFAYEVKYKEADCEYAGMPMVVRRKVTRGVCDACRECRKNWVKKRSRPKVQARKQVIPATRKLEEVARVMRLSVRRVQELEQSALTKLRSSPALLEAYSNFKEDGMPMIEDIWNLLRELLTTRNEDKILEFQQELMEWCRTLEVAREAGVGVDRATAAVDQCRRLLIRELDIEAEPRPGD